MGEKRLSPEEKAAIAMAWLAPLKKGLRPRPYEELVEVAKRNGDKQASTKTIAQAIRYAFERDLVSVKQNPFTPVFGPRSDLETRLRSKFSKLDQAIVTESETIASSDQVHIQIGTALGTAIFDQKPFRSGDIIGIGSGRGVYYAVEGLLRESGDRPPASNNVTDKSRTAHRSRKEREIYIMSLMGSVFPHSTRSSKELLFDSDITAAMLAQFFDGWVHLRPISYPIALTKAAKAELIRQTSLDDTNFSKMTPTHAIVGMGVLTSTHRFAMATQTPNPAPVLNPIYANLSTLVDRVDKIMADHPEYCPVADVCGRMFVVPPPLSFSAKMRNWITNEIDPLIHTLNDCLLTITKTQLGQVSEKMMLVAGTPIKARGIHYLLKHPRLKVDILSTDSLVAEALLRM